MSARSLCLVLVATFVLLSAKPARAQERPAWAVGGALTFSPFESYPRFGLGAEASRALGARFRLGAELSFYAHRHSGDVTRSAFAANGILQYSLASGSRLRWYMLGGLGVALFRDRYDARSVYADETSVGPGVVLGTGLELRLGDRIDVFLEPRAVSYRTSTAVDDEWLEAKLGARWYAF
jgi:hypothetical protein